MRQAIKFNGGNNSNLASLCDCCLDWFAAFRALLIVSQSKARENR